jgi:glutaryl-CoA dehydrogenase
MDDLLTQQERSIRDRVRAFADNELIPVANKYWERAEFPAELLPAYAGLGVAGGAIQGYGCPGMSPVAEGLERLICTPRVTLAPDGSRAPIRQWKSGDWI